MRVRFIARMLAIGYSGGRLLALTMAESLAMTGAEVDFLVDNIPEMYEEFRSYSRVCIICTNFSNLSPLVDRNIDIIVVVPDMESIVNHGEWTRYAIECHAKIVLLNFESPNWFNEISPFKRRVELWKGWDIVSEYASLILSISGEGNRYAREYYKSCPKKCVFAFSYPGINTVLADKAKYVAQREKQIVMLTRIDPHKGFNSLKPLMHRDLEGYRVVMFIGTGKIANYKLKCWRVRFAKVGMEFEICSAIKGIDKFAMLKKSSLLYFPTRFEGFGIPPLEAVYCLLPCACSDLPVLREFGQQALVYGNPENYIDMLRAVKEALKSGDRLIKEHERISKIANMYEYGRRVEEIFKQIL